MPGFQISHGSACRDPLCPKGKPFTSPTVWGTAKPRMGLQAQAAAGILAHLPRWLAFPPIFQEPACNTQSHVGATACQSNLGTAGCSVGCECNEALWVWSFQGPDSTGMCPDVGNRVYFSWVRIRFESRHFLGV